MSSAQLPEKTRRRQCAISAKEKELGNKNVRFAAPPNFSQKERKKEKKNSNENPLIYIFAFPLPTPSFLPPARTSVAPSCSSWRVVPLLDRAPQQTGRPRPRIYQTVNRKRRDDKEDEESVIGEDASELRKDGNINQIMDILHQTAGADVLPAAHDATVLERRSRRRMQKCISTCVHKGQCAPGDCVDVAKRRAQKGRTDETVDHICKQNQELQRSQARCVRLGQLLRRGVGHWRAKFGAAPEEAAAGE